MTAFVFVLSATTEQYLYYSRGGETRGGCDPCGRNRFGLSQNGYGCKGMSFHTHPLRPHPFRLLKSFGLSECRSTPADATTGPSRHSNKPPKMGHARSAHLALIRSTGASRCTLRATQIRRMTTHCPEIEGPNKSWHHGYGAH